MNNMNAKQYTIEIRFGEFEGENCYEAKIKELPNLAEYADTYEEAYALAIDSIETLAAIYAEKGKIFPQPLQHNENEYSGRVTLRLPRRLHANIAISAEEEAVSLNALINSVLSAYVGFGSQFKHTAENWLTLESKKTAQAATATIHNIRDYQSCAVVNG